MSGEHQILFATMGLRPFLFDPFTGTTIDTSKWVETDPDSLISQNNQLIYANPHTGTIPFFQDNLKSVASIASGVAVVQGYITWTTDNNNEAIGGIFLWKDNNNFAYIGSRSIGGTFRLLICSGGVQWSYSYESEEPKARDVKIWTDGISVKFYTFSIGVWVQRGITQTFSLGYPLKCVLSGTDSAAFAGANPVYIDNVYFTASDYATQYPVET